MRIDGGGQGIFLIVLLLVLPLLGEPDSQPTRLFDRTAQPLAAHEAPASDCCDTVRQDFHLPVRQGHARGMLGQVPILSDQRGLGTAASEIGGNPSRLGKLVLVYKLKIVRSAQVRVIVLCT